MTEHEIKNRKHDLRILRSEHRLQGFKVLAVPRLVEREEAILRDLRDTLMQGERWTTT